jgi:hypothetical protein
MQTLASERSMREKVWQSMEPTQASMDRVIARVDRKMNNHLQFARSFSTFKRLTTAAACIVIGVMVGRYGNWNRLTSAPQTPTNSGTAVVAQNPQTPPVTVATAEPYMLPIYNEYGQKVDEMRFASKEEADRFTKDLQQNNRNSGPNGGAVLTNTPAPADGQF